MAYFELTFKHDYGVSTQKVFGVSIGDAILSLRRKVDTGYFKIIAIGSVEETSWDSSYKTDVPKKYKRKKK